MAIGEAEYEVQPEPSVFPGRTCSFTDRRCVGFSVGPNACVLLAAVASRNCSDSVVLRARHANSRRKAE
eukprot:CAMPEP_0171679636 /NCGR_PEP_ID=MMETSP0990-20121206/56354_1 /TAXON_ID=483369 /ORGANISM="non described non described, Strain CCMP2098" /LENGTH=68 /DNA_ID=CAMNT_0012266457 /DNA_START=779 /DNA_END=985 /DNA_ORIENTATION=-